MVLSDLTPGYLTCLKGLLEILRQPANLKLWSRVMLGGLAVGGGRHVTNVQTLERAPSGGLRWLRVSS